MQVAELVLSRHYALSCIKFHTNLFPVVAEWLPCTPRLVYSCNGEGPSPSLVQDLACLQEKAGKVCVCVCMCVCLYTCIYVYNV